MDIQIIHPCVVGLKVIANYSSQHCTAFRDTQTGCRAGLMRTKSLRKKLTVISGKVLLFRPE